MEVILLLNSKMLAVGFEPTILPGRCLTDTRVFLFHHASDLLAKRQQTLVSWLPLRFLIYRNRTPLISCHKLHLTITHSGLKIHT